MYRVKAYATWEPEAPTFEADFADLELATTIAQKREEPLIDVIDLSRGLVVAVRRVIPHPTAHEPWPYRDDFPNPRAFSIPVSAIERCPDRNFLPSHYRPGGPCLHFDLDVEAIA